MKVLLWVFAIIGVLRFIPMIITSVFGLIAISIPIFMIIGIVVVCKWLKAVFKDDKKET